MLGCEPSFGMCSGICNSKQREALRKTACQLRSAVGPKQLAAADQLNVELHKVRQCTDQESRDQEPERPSVSSTFALVHLGTKRQRFSLNMALILLVSCCTSYWSRMSLCIFRVWGA